MSWAVICRQNQARSIIAAATLRKFFTNKEIASFGIEANTGQPIPHSIATLARNWSLGSFDRTSKAVDDAWLSSNNASILSADEIVTEVLTPINEKLKITTLTQLADDYRISPADPAGYSPEKLATEIAKVLILALRWGYREENLEPDIKSHLICSEDESFCLPSEPEIPATSLIIDTDLRLPENKNWYGAREVATFNPRRLNEISPDQFNRPNLILRSAFEIDDLDRIFTSLKWRNFLIHLAKNRPVVLVSNFPNQAASPIPTLALCHSMQTRIW